MESSIRDLSGKCDRLFHQMALMESSGSHDVVEALRQSFRRWTTNLGVYANPKLSLDASLAYSESLKNLVMEFLQTVLRNLLRVEILEMQHYGPSDETGVDSHDSIIDQMSQTATDRGLSSILVESLRALESAIDSLLLLGSTIQESSASTLTQRVSNFVRRKDDGIRDNILYLYLKHRLVDQERRNGNIGAALSLCRQLARSGSFRCFRVDYIRSRAAKKRHALHQKETEPSQTPNVLGATRARHEELEAEERIPATHPRVEPLKKSARQNPPQKGNRHRVPLNNAPQSETAPSIPDSNVARQKFREHSESFFPADSVCSIRVAGDIRYPQKPSIDLFANAALCPYCCKLFPSSDYEKPGWWERHLDHDLQLYTCISPDCEEPPQLFTRFEEWKKHVNVRHSARWISETHVPVRWRCGGNGNHDETWFDDEAAIRQHIEDEHPDQSGDLDMEVWMEECQVDTPRPDYTCPVCNMIPDKLATILCTNHQGTATKHVAAQDKELLQDELLRHIGHHLKEIGLLSLHCLYDGQDESESQTSIDQNRNDLPPGLWQDGEWAPPVPYYLDEEFLDYTSQEVPQLRFPIDWFHIKPTGTTALKEMSGNSVWEHWREMIRNTFSTSVSVFDETAKSFMPEGLLHGIISRDVLEKELRRYSESDEELLELVGFILGQTLKVFATALLIGITDTDLYQAMSVFKRHGFSDKALPIAIPDETEHIFYRFGRPWLRGRVHEFYHHQWSFLSPVFRADMREQRIHGGHIARLEAPCMLPFVGGAGSHHIAFGQFLTYTVHPNHIHDPEEPVDPVLGRVLTLQIFRPRDAAEREAISSNWDQVVDTLHRVNMLRQENIVRFITAFRHGAEGEEDYYLAFERPGAGNLLTLWRREMNHPYLTAQLVRATIKQLSGLATALCAAHFPATGPAIHHGELDPASILWFGGEDESGIGTLKIAHWGQTKTLGYEAQLRGVQTTVKDRDAKYYPPEEDPEQRTGGLYERCSTHCDVWAMGCIALEFVIWLLYGIQGLEDFMRAMRRGPAADSSFPFYQRTGPTEVRVRATVVQCINHMRGDPACEPGATVLGDLLELIETRLLVVSTTERASSDEYKQRMAALKVIPSQTTHPPAGSYLDEKPFSVVLRDDLASSLVISAVTGLNFIPISALVWTVTPWRVLVELKRVHSSLTNRIQTLNFKPKAKDTDPGLCIEAKIICGLSQVDRAESLHARLDWLPAPVPQYRKIFAILSLINKTSRISHFVEENVCDDDLPLVKVSNSSGLFHPIELCRRGDVKRVPLKCFKKPVRWRNSTVAKFEAVQWVMLAPSFHYDGRGLALHYMLPDHAILPFTRWEPIDHGGFSFTYRAEIHPDHHGFQVQDTIDLGITGDGDGVDDGRDKRENDVGEDKAKKAAKSTNVFAVMRILSQTRDESRRQLDLLRRISRHQHPHLVPLLATYEYRGAYYIIFPLAAADLGNYWRERYPKKTAETVSWIAGQCLGLAGALATIHRSQTSLSDSFRTRLHHDTQGDGHLTKANAGTPGPRPKFPGGCQHCNIEPRSILWFPSPTDLSVPPSLISEHGGDQHRLGILKITANGATQLDGKRSTTSETTSSSYRAPEDDLLHHYLSKMTTKGDDNQGDNKDAMILQMSTTYDIWSLGCLFLEFVAWFFEGWKGVETFFFERSTEKDPAMRRLRTGEFFVLDIPGASVGAGSGGHGNPHLHAPDQKVNVGARVKPEVYQFIEKIQNTHCLTSHFFHDLPVLIRDEMLVIGEPGHREPVEGSSRGATTSSSPRRSNANRIKECLSDMVLRGEEDADYFLRPV